MGGRLQDRPATWLQSARTEKERITGGEIPETAGRRSRCSARSLRPGRARPRGNRCEAHLALADRRAGPAVQASRRSRARRVLAGTQPYARERHLWNARTGAQRIRNHPVVSARHSRYSSGPVAGKMGDDPSRFCRRRKQGNMIATVDQRARDRFALELSRNFSVIASAGSGKTRSITDRIVQIAKSARALDLLPKLVVVTYTNRAADEMQQRTREQILKANLPLEVIEAFNRAFFGTIHSFCVKLLAAHGHHLGLPSSLELITDDEELWNQFVQQQIVVGRTLTPENRRVLLRHIQGRQLMELARHHELDLASIEPDTPCPDTSFDEVYKAVARGNTLRTIPRAQVELK